MTLITEWIAERGQVLERNKALLTDLNVEEYSYDRDTGVVHGVIFKSAPHPDWRKPGKHGISYAKKGTDWAKRLQDQKGHRKASDLISETLGIPTHMRCTGADGAIHSKELGHWFNPCQFASMGTEPPFLLVIPNVAYYVAEAESEGLTVPDEVKAFKPEFEGCRPISVEDWEIMVMQRKAAQQKATTV